MTGSELEQEQDEAVQRAQQVLADIRALTQRVEKIQDDFTSAPLDVISARSTCLQSIQGAKAESRSLAQLASQTAQSVQRLAHEVEVVREREAPEKGQRNAQEYVTAHQLSSELQSSANAMRDLLDQVYEGMVTADRASLVESQRKAAHAARNHIEVSVQSLSRPQQTASRREFTVAVQEEERLVPIQRKQVKTLYASSTAQTPAAGAPPLGVAMTGEPSMPTGWVIPGESGGHWMWAQLTILGTDKVLVLPVRRCEVAEVQEALGKMLGRSYEDLKLFVRAGCHTRRLLPTDQLPSRVLVKGISSWERQKQKYNHPFAIVGAGHLGLRQALECLRQGNDDFVVFERLDQVGGETWQRLANSSSRLQTEFGTYHLPFDSSYPTPQAAQVWPSREEILAHFQTAAADYGVLPHVRLQMNLTGLKIEKMSRLQMLEEGRGDSDPNAQHYKLALQPQKAFRGLSSQLKEKEKEKGRKEKEKKKEKGQSKATGEAGAEAPDAAAEGDSAAAAEKADGAGAGAGAGAEPGGAETGAETTETSKSAFLASAVLVFPGLHSVPREEAFKGEEQFGGPVAKGFGDEFDFEQARGKLVAICGMGSLAIEDLRGCIDHAAQRCHIVCRRKNMVLPRCVSWLVNQSSVPAAAPELLKAMLPMYSLAADEPYGYEAVSPSAACVRQSTRFPVSDLLFLAVYYGQAEVKVGEVKRLLHQMLVLEDGTKLEAHCILKAFGFTASFEIEQIMHSSKMFGYWPDADFRRWIFCESTGVDFFQLSTTSLSPLAMRVAAYPLHFLAFPKPDFKDMVDAGSMPWQSPDPDSNQPAYVLGAREAMSVLGLVLTFAPALQERSDEYEAVRRRRQLQCHPLKAFLTSAMEEWSSYCQLLAGAEGAAKTRETPAYPYPPEVLTEMASRLEKDGKKRLASVSLGAVAPEEGDTRNWSPYLQLFC